MDTIKEITLEHSLPAVFAGSDVHSDVWKQSVAFARPGAWMIEAASGTGKTSLCAYIYGVRTDFSGDILFDGRSVRNFTVGEWCSLRRTALAWLPQELHLFPELSVTDNILLKNRLTDYKSGAEIRRMLEALEVEGKAHEPAGRLSVGQQQRVAIVRALCQPFSFLMADEPVSHLDARNNAAVAALVAGEAEAQQAGVIVTSVGNRLQLPYAKTLLL